MFGERLKLARKKSGLSLRALSAALDGDVSAQAIGKYERGEMMPGSRVLSRLAHALNVTLEYLLSNQVEALDGVEFRKHSGTSAKERAQVEAEVVERLERYLAIEEILDFPPSLWREELGEPRHIAHEKEVEGLAEGLRERWKLGCDPIPNMTALLEDKGLKVLLLPLPDRVSGLTCLVRQRSKNDSLPVIVVNQYHTLERRRHTIGHELGHRLLAHSSPINEERASSHFAGAFMVPKAHLIEEVGKHRNALGYKEIIDLKRMYRISAAALLMRLKQVDIISESTLIYAFQNVARTWRKNEPAPLEINGARGKYEQPKRFERLCYRALAEQHISPGKAMELLGLPLEEIEKNMRGPEDSADYRQ